MTHPVPHLAALFVIAALGGCTLPGFVSFPEQVRGNKVDADLMKELVPGTSSRADVSSLIGSPTARATFDDNTWIYITEMTKPIIGGTEHIASQQVVVLTFDQRGILKGIETKNKDDSMPVSVVARTTPSPGSEASMLQMLLGNVGKFSPLPSNNAQAGNGGGGLSTTVGQ